MKKKYILLSLFCCLFFVFNAQAQTLYSVTPKGGNNNVGTISKYIVGTNNSLVKVWDFDKTSGDFPSGQLIQASNGKLYGMTLNQDNLIINLASSNFGAIFSFDLSNLSYTKLKDFDKASGSLPFGSLIQASDGKLYGMTQFGGSSNAGVIFSFDLSNSIYTDLKDFDNVSGDYPFGSLVQAKDGKLYGMTQWGGKNGFGVIFSFDPSTTTYTTLKDFDNVSGATPTGSLIQASDGKLYGMTQEGGSGNVGVIFSLDPSNSTYTKLMDFDRTNSGALPYGSLIQASDGKLYGMTFQGGTNNVGVIFSFDPSTTVYTKLKDFDNNSGAHPQGNFMQASDGKLYGMTSSGGTIGSGVIFSFDPSTSVYTKIEDYAGANGAGPSYGSAFIEAKNIITTSPLSATNYCLGTSLPVAYTISGTYNSGNIFTAQLSDASGSFNAPTNIGSLTVTTSGNINATIPNNTPAGNGYRIRVVSSDPAITGSDNGANITVNALPTVSVTSSNPHLYFGAPGNQSSTITATPTGGTAPYTITFTMNRGLISDYINDAGDEAWTATGSTTTSANPPSTFNGIAEGGSASINVALLADADITATVTDANGCSQTAASVHVIAEDARCFAGNSDNVKVLMCHLTNSAKNPSVQICVNENAVQAHLNQGDFLGSCTVNAREMNPNATSAYDPTQGEEGLGKLSVTVMPNPASYHFTIVLKSQSNENVKLTVTDITGRVIEMKTNVSANSTIQLGDNYHPGVYIAKLLQGKDIVTLRLIKGGN